ncbi:branched-chain amino acid transport system permease protein [Thermocatellispora tengchongensis]|uniref:Branched-chain amino acid transport system permease protein n=1 Tax=Thermocatellispora tengchongensis TaxID=1073253 RepID=A0A840P1M5_9ACTN|nr:branched-chain amino acid ABC transporter permease [Thermocatellispora tengchongensis]MBB5131791.1 branched-chain amino acid transport system permease protein [Thermocatellispora tengchongensis]
MDWILVISRAVEASIGTEAVIYALAAIGLNVHFGYTGLLNFGQAAFLAIGAYSIATTVTTFGLPFFLGVTIGLALSVVLALLMGIPTLRLRADYLAIVTIAAAEIIRLVVRSVALQDVFGGTDGIQAFSGGFYALNPYPEGDYNIGPIIGFDENTMWVLTVGWILVALSCGLIYLLMKSPWGRVLKAIREDEDAVRSLGKNVFSYKMQSLVLGGVIGALAGFIFALSRSAVQPESYNTELTFYAYTVLILGGTARILGPVVGAAIFWGLLILVGTFLEEAVNTGTITFITTTQVGPIRYMLVGLGLMLLLIYRPQGIFGDKREIALDAR